MKVVIVAYSFDLAYHTVRCARIAGHEIYVLGADTAVGFKFLPLCSGFRSLEYRPNRDHLDAAVSEIAAYIADIGAESVVPVDIVSTRLLISIASRLPVSTCLLPSADVFDKLNNKWTFYKLCCEIQVSTPETIWRSDFEEVRTEILSKKIQLPIVIKPVVGMATQGVFIIRYPLDIERIKKRPQGPLLVQKYISGAEVDISIVAKGGKVRAYAVQSARRARYHFSRNQKLYDSVQKLAKFCSFEGVAHFDAIEQEGTGEMYLLECNPRFWYSIYASCAAGANFFDICLSPPDGKFTLPLAVDSSVVPTRRAVFFDLLRLSWTPQLAFMIRYYLSDVFGTAADYFKLFSDHKPGIGGIDHQLIQLEALQSRN